MIKEDYVSFEVAKLLKEKGFKEITQGYINTDQEVYMCPFQQGMYELGDKQFPYPTHQMALKWLREEKGIIIIILHGCNAPIDNGWCFAIQQKGNDLSESTYISYEEAVEAALLHVLKNLI